MKRLQISILLLILAGAGYARTPDEAEFQAAIVLGQDIAEWVVDRENKPRTLGIYYVNSNTPLDQDYSRVVETEITKNLAEKGLNKITSCAECRTPQVNVQDDRVVVTRGAPDSETVRKIGVKYPVEAFLMVELYRTKLAVTAQAVLVKNPSGELIGGERFKVPALNLTDASAQVMLLLGLGKPLGTVTTTGTSSLITSGNLLLLEELGFGKGGLNIGGVFGNGGSLIYVNPTLMFRGRIGSSMVSWGTVLGVGYGFGSGTRGFAVRGALDFFLGSLTVMGLEGSYFFPDSTTATTDVLKGFAGIHIGITLGR